MSARLLQIQTTIASYRGDIQEGESSVGPASLRYVGTKYGMPDFPDLAAATHRRPRYRLRLYNGYRLGYGKGFYDRFLANCPHAIPIGLAYQIQVVEDTFPQVWDVPVKHIFTETGRIDI